MLLTVIAFIYRDMSEHTNPQFSDVLSLLDNLPTMPKKAPFETTGEDTLTHLSQWLGYYSRVYDFSKGFEVNRCALYWAGYDESDAFDGKKFVDSCKYIVDRVDICLS